AGYIITGTFLVAIVKSIPSLSDYAALSWMFVGLGAIPSTILWSMLADMLGHGKATYLAFILQIISVTLPILSESMLSLILSLLLFGSTFFWLTRLFISKAQALMYLNNSKLNFVSIFTFIYSLGQMIAYVLSVCLIISSRNFNEVLLI